MSDEVFHVPVLRNQAFETIVKPDDTSQPTEVVEHAESKLQRAANTVAENLAITSQSLDPAVSAINGILQRLRARFDENYELGDIQFRLGISAGGEVGLLGTGVNVKADASFTITLKAK